MAHLQFLLICLIWGTSFVLMKKAHVVFGPATIGGLRALCGAAVLWMLWHTMRRGAERRWPLRMAHLLPLLVPALIGFAFPYVMQPHLVGKYQDSAYFGMMVALVPLVTIVISVPMLGVWPRWREVVGVLIGLGCLALLAGDGQERGVVWYDFALAALVPTAYAASNTFIKQRFHSVPPLALTCSALAMAGMVLLPVGVATEPMKPGDTSTLTTAVAAMAVLSVLGTGLAMFMFYRLIQSHGPLFAGMVTYLVPLGALMWGWLDREAVTGTQLLAMAGIFLGVGLVQWPGRAAARTERRAAEPDAVAAGQACVSEDE